MDSRDYMTNLVCKHCGVKIKLFPGSEDYIHYIDDMRLPYYMCSTNKKYEHLEGHLSAEPISKSDRFQHLYNKLNETC